MKKKISAKINGIAKTIAFFVIIKSVIFSCIKNNTGKDASADLQLPPIKSFKQEAGARFYKEDTFRFHYLKNSHNTSTTDSSSSYQGNIYLILPRRQ